MSLRTDYRVIVADPPWTYITWSDKAHKTAARHYDLMDNDDISTLPVASYAADDAMLLLWSTWPNLVDCISVGQAWGFEYKTLGFIWLKRTTTGKHWHTGLGYYSRANTEPCLLFTRGSIKRLSAAVHQIIDDTQPPLPLWEETLVARIGRHSAKPELFYHNVEKLVAGPYLSLFERRTRKGWDVVGNEIDGRDIRDVLVGEAAL